MKEELTYTEAFGQLQAIVKRMEDADISVDDLADHIKQASKLIKICKDKLTKIEQEVNKNIAELS
ncbi:MAG: exodeoxyribonuclease VII small subunit [Bacteroidales bacterium]|jgi:exodeoxyribonuclease VII small subunit|nr:exodeoxyribonuclease VII small subunit [Bacteroidales bacterium]